MIILINVIYNSGELLGCFRLDHTSMTPCEEPLEVKNRRIFLPHLISQSLGFWIAKNTILCPLYDIDAKPNTYHFDHSMKFMLYFL